MELRQFEGNPSEWPEFISNFCVSFNDSKRMERLLSALEDETKKSVESIGCKGIFYATALKSWKRDFGSPVLVSHWKIKSIFDQPHQYHQKIKITNTWLLSMGYKNAILSYENLPKGVTHIPNTVFSKHIFKQFFKATRDCNLNDGANNLLAFEDWLERQIKDFFNPLTKIIFIQEARTKYQHPPKEHFKKRNIFLFHERKWW